MNMKQFRYGRLGQIRPRTSPSNTSHRPLLSEDGSEESHERAGTMKSDPGIQQWWKIQEAAYYLAVSVAFLRKKVRQRGIPFRRVGSKALRFRQQDLDAWLETDNNSGGGEVSCDDGRR